MDTYESITRQLAGTLLNEFGDQDRRTLAHRAHDLVQARDQEHEANKQRLTLRIDIDQSSEEPGWGHSHVGETYEEAWGKVKVLGTGHDWRVQKVHDVDGGQRRRDLWVAVNVEETHGKEHKHELTSRVLKDLARGIAQEWAWWADGNVYGFSIEDANGDHVDSCWGYYCLPPWEDGSSYLWEAIREAIPDGARITRAYGNAGIDDVSDIPDAADLPLGEDA